MGKPIVSYDGRLMQAQTGQSFQRRDGPTGFEPTNSNNLHIQWKINEQPYERFSGKATLIQTNRYTKENKKETDLIVKAYAYLPFYLLLDNITVYLLALLNVMGLTVFFYMKRHTKKQAQTMRLSPLETEKRKTDPSKWCSIHEGFLWNEREHSIKHNEKTIILNGESLKFFKLFLKKRLSS